MTEAWCGTSTRSLVALRMLSLRCLLGDGLRGEGLGIPALLRGCQSSSCRGVFFLVQCVVGDMEWVGFFWLLGGERGVWECRLPGAYRASVMDVPCDYAAQVFEFCENVEVPQIPFLDRVL